MDIDNYSNTGGISSPASSVHSLPPFTADPKDISIAEHPEEASVVSKNVDFQIFNLKPLKISQSDHQYGVYIYM